MTDNKPKRIHIVIPDDWESPEGAIRVDIGEWRNPFKVGPSTGCIEHGDTIDLYRRWLNGDLTVGGRDVYHRAKKELKGKSLACTCPILEPCHANVLMVVANTDRPILKPGDHEAEKERKRQVYKDMRHVTSPSGRKR